VVTVGYNRPMWWVGGGMAGWLLAASALLPALGRWFLASRQPPAPSPTPREALLPRPQLRLVPDPPG